MRLGNDFIISEECEWDDDDVDDGEVRRKEEELRENSVWPRAFAVTVDCCSLRPNIVSFRILRIDYTSQICIFIRF